MVKDHLGNEYSSNTEMCKAYKIKLDTFLRRIKRGLSIEEALTHPVGKGSSKKIIDPYTGIEYDSMRAICLEYNMPYDAFYHRIEKGMSIEEALSFPSNRNNVIKVTLTDIYRLDDQTVEKNCTWFWNS